jgi:pyruvate,water dikinase
MIASNFSGTAFSVHPVTGKKNEIFIESCHGLGETLVLGKETPTTHVIAKNTSLITYKKISQQIKGIRRAQNGTGNEVYFLKGNNCCENILSDEKVIEIAKTVTIIESHFGFPVDVEWAYKDGNLYILQSRPITNIVE